MNRKLKNAVKKPIEISILQTPRIEPHYQMQDIIQVKSKVEKYDCINDGQWTTMKLKFNLKLQLTLDGFSLMTWMVQKLELILTLELGHQWEIFNEHSI